MATGATKAAQRRAVTKADWARLAFHQAVLPSGAVVKFRIPDLSILLKTGAVPAQLQNAARAEQFGWSLRTARKMLDNEDITDEDMDMSAQVDDLGRWIVAYAVKEPEITVDDIEAGHVPTEDVQMITEFIQRARQQDAEGNWMGVAPLEAYEPFLRGYECSPGCEACKSKRDSLSNGRVG